MKKYLFSALALPLLFACSSDDLIEKEVASNDQFAGIEKVDATFSMDEGVITRFDGGLWKPEENDVWGFAWLGNTAIEPGVDPTYSPGKVFIDGKAYQNHNLIQTNGIFKPQTSIYVGKYFLYRPYDETTVSPQAINFNSLIDQPMAEGYESAKQPWKDLAKTAINIGDKWTEVTPTGNPAGTDWNKAGIKKHYDIYGAVFSNQTGLDLKYSNNNPEFGADARIYGATDIDYTIAKGKSAGDAKLYGATVKLAGAANSFTYAPTKEPLATVNAALETPLEHSGTFWANKKKTDLVNYTGFTFTDGADALITLTAPEGAPIGTGVEGKGTKGGWFWFNSLPVTSGDAAVAEPAVGTLLNLGIETKIKTSYGTVTVNSTVGECAYEGKNFGTEEHPDFRWIRLAEADVNPEAATTAAMSWNPTLHNTFVNHFGNHKGKYELAVDFSKAVMDIHITDDDHLQTYLKYYIASGKQNNAGQENIVLILDGDADKEFKLSKLSIALLQTINRAENKPTVKVQGCDVAAHNAPANETVKIVVTQDGQDKLDPSLATKTEVPALNNVFAAPTRVYLAAKNSDGNAIAWTWGGDYDGDGDVEFDQALPIDDNVRSVRNLGTITVNATNLELSNNSKAIYNEAGATMNITKVTTAKSTLINFGTINVGSATNTTAELRAYGKEIINDATELDAYGIINNFGAVGVTYNTGGVFSNYGLIDMKNEGAKTLLTRNQTTNANFKNAFNAANNKLGTVVLPDNNPFAIVSVSNAPETGFVKFNWKEYAGDASATYVTPTGGIVKYNTLVVNSDIAFTEPEDEIQYIQFEGDALIKVTNSAAVNLPELRGIIVTDGSSLLIEKTNVIVCSQSAYVGAGATIYNGGTFTPNATLNGTTATNYLGTWSTDQVVVYGNQN
jgi:hypothetical protein